MSAATATPPTDTSPLPERVSAGGLALLSSTQWSAEQGQPPMLPGFVLSAFSPVVAAVAEHCLHAHYRQPPASRGARTAVVIVSTTGDVGTATALADAVDRETRVPPLLFFQAVPNAVAGHIAARWGLGGPVVCVSPTGEPLDEALAVVRLLVRDGEADEALVVLVEQSEPDTAEATALLVAAPDHSPAADARPTPTAPPTEPPPSEGVGS